MIWCGRPSRRLRQHRQCVRVTSSGRRGAVPLSSASKTLLRARAESLRRVRLLTQGRDSDSWELRLFHLFRGPVHSDRQAASGRSSFSTLATILSAPSRRGRGSALASSQGRPHPDVVLLGRRQGHPHRPSGEPSRPRRTTAFGANRSFTGNRHVVAEKV
jgi:hypothetical protein